MTARVVKLPHRVMVRLDDDTMAALSAFVEASDSETTASAVCRLATRRFLAATPPVTVPAREDTENRG